VLVLKEAGLVYLSNPKTATQSLRAILVPHAGATPENTGEKHINAALYARKWAALLAARLGRPPNTFAVMREPQDHLGSWYRYRQRDALRGHENATHDVSFAEFIEAVLTDDPPPFARIGRQARFLGFLHDVPPVDFIFDYARLDLMMDFLNKRLGTDLRLPRRNVSPEAAGTALTLPDTLVERLRAVLAVEFALYEKVSGSGILESETALSVKVTSS